MLRDNRTGIEKKTALSRGINVRHYSIRNQREIYNNREKRTIVVWHCRSQKKKKIIPTNGRIFLNNDIPFYAQEKFVINNTNRIIIKIIN